MSTSVPVQSRLVNDLASLLAAGILRLSANSTLNSPESAAACLEVPAPTLLTVSAPRVNGEETPSDEGSEA
jgi:hypothetical protein